MAKAPEDLVLRLLRDLREAQDAFRGDLNDFRKQLQSMRARIEEMHETSITALESL
jgi:hypothetical protein